MRRGVAVVALVVAGGLVGQAIYGDGGPAAMFDGPVPDVGPGGPVGGNATPTPTTTRTASSDGPALTTTLRTPSVPPPSNRSTWSPETQFREYDAVNERLVSRGVRDRLDEVRAANGRPPLEPDASLRDVAERHSENMALNEYVGHVWPSGQNRSDRFVRYGRPCRVLWNKSFTGGAEAVTKLTVEPPANTTASSFSYPEEPALARQVTSTLLAAPDARRDLLAPYRRQVGVGTAVRRDRDTLTVYVSVDLC